MAIGLKAILSRLNDTSRKALEDGASLCVSRTHYNVEIEHFLMKLMEAGESDFARILKQFGVDRARVAAELTRALDGFKRGNARMPGWTPTLIRMFTEAWS